MSDWWYGFVVGELIGILIGGVAMYKMAMVSINKAHERAIENLKQG